MSLPSLVRTVYDGGRPIPEPIAARLAQRIGQPAWTNREVGVLEQVVSSSETGTQVLLTLRDPGKRSRLQQLRMRIAGRRRPAAMRSDSDS
jgi:hypothetical protein